MDQGTNSHATMESNLSKQTHMGYVPLAYGWHAYGVIVEKEMVTYAKESFVQKSQGFSHHHHHINKNTFSWCLSLRWCVRGWIGFP
jgi:hypothetical protein